MKRKISSDLTVFYKFFTPALSLFILLGYYWDASKDSLDYLNLKKELLFIVIAIGLYLLFWFNLRCKDVSIEGNFLYISNYLKEIKVPLSEIGAVTEFVFLNEHPVTIHLKNPSKFGKKIVFLPTYRMFSFYSSHPIVKELRRLANIKQIY